MLNSLNNGEFELGFEPTQLPTPTWLAQTIAEFLKNQSHLYYILKIYGV